MLVTFTFPVEFEVEKEAPRDYVHFPLGESRLNKNSIRSIETEIQKSKLQKLCEQAYVNL